MKLTEKQWAEYDENEANNQHDANAELLAQVFADFTANPKALAVVKAINIIQADLGYLPKELADRRYQITNPIWRTVSANAKPTNTNQRKE